VGEMKPKRGHGRSYLSDYTLGKLEILKLRATISEKWHNFSLQDFHDRLSNGSPLSRSCARVDGRDGPLL